MKLDLILLLLMPIVSMFLSFALKANLLLSTLMFLGFPIIWLMFRNRNRRDMLGRVALFAFVLTAPLTVMVDYLLSFNQTWHLPVTVFPFRLFGHVAFEQFVWTFLFAYSILLCREHFYPRDEDPQFTPRIVRLGLCLGMALIVFLAIMIFKENWLKIPYTYAVVGLGFIVIPLALFMVLFSKFPLRFLPIAGYFFFQAIFFEYTGLELKQWVFPGDEIIMWLPFFGHKLPLEELVYWFIMAAFTVQAYYEFPMKSKLQPSS